MDDQLNVFKEEGVIPEHLVNYKPSISTVKGCIDLCKQYSQCQWWNYNPVHRTCWLKKGRGTPWRDSQNSKMYTGHRNSTVQCQNKDFSVAEEIESVITKECDKKQNSISVRVPVEIINKYGIESMTLNDPSCVLSKTETEWSFSSHKTLCGSISGWYGNYPKYTNHLNIVFGEGPFAGNETKYAKYCHKLSTSNDKF